MEFSCILYTLYLSPVLGVLGQFCFNAECSMRNTAQSFFWDKLSCNTANSVCFIFNTDKRILQVLNMFFLARSKLCDLFARHSVRSIFQHFKCRRSVVCSMLIAVSQCIL